MDNYKDLILCDLCGGSFDSQCKHCKKCENYSEGLTKFGHTKSNLEYQVEMLVELIRNELNMK